MYQRNERKIKELKGDYVPPIFVIHNLRGIETIKDSELAI
jgi:hypothetical protein